MSVVSTDPYSTATGNGAATAFPFFFACRNVGDVAVYVNGAQQSSGYTVTLNSGFNGGTVTFSVAPANLAAILLASAPSLSQSITFVNSGPYNPSSVDGANDAAAIRDIYLKGLIDRSPLVPIGEIMGPVPAKASRAGLVFGFDAQGNPVALNPGGADSSLRSDLASGTGAGLVGFDPTLTYSAGTFGAFLKGLVSGPAVADEAISAGQLVNLIVTSGVTHMRLANATDPTKPAHAYASGTVAMSATGSWVRRGIIPGTSGTAFAADLWLSDSSPGGVTSTPPSVVGEISQHIGMVLPGIGIEFNPQPEVLL